MKTATLRTKKGVIEVELHVNLQKITDIKITGDFFIYPEEALEDIETALKGSTATKDAITTIITNLYHKKHISSPGITIDDWVSVILKALIV